MKNRIPPELLQKIKDAVSIIEIVGEHVVLKKSGANYSGLCPFHSERSPSFSVSDQKGLYHCYGCKAGGDLVKFFQEIHGLSFMEAVEELAERAKIALPKDIGGSDSEDPAQKARRQAQQEKTQVAYKLNRFVAAYYHQMLPKLSQADQYFRMRGVNADLGRAFYVGASPASWDSLAEHLTKAKAPVEIAVELGLIRPSKNAKQQGSGYFDLFRNRAIFPILDLRGRVAGFGGRILPGGNEDDKSSPKYLNSSESFIYHKGKLAYGLYQAQKHVREMDEVVLVEGYFDVLALHGAGFQNAVAISGTSMTFDHLTAFRRLGQKVTLLLDGDKAGIAATERAMETGLEKGLVLYGATMPLGRDPDEVLFDQQTGRATRDGREQMKAILSAAKPLLDSRIEEAAQEAKTGAEARTTALKRVAGWLAKFSDPVGREIRLETVQQSFGVSRALVDRAVQEAGGGRGQGSAGTMNVRTQQPQQQQTAGPRNPQSRPQSPGPTPRPTRRQAVARPAEFGKHDKILLTALVRGGVYAESIAQARQHLTAKLTFSDLFDYIPARHFVTALMTDPQFLERFSSAPDAVLQEEVDPQIRTTVMEALMASQPPFADSELKFALERASRRALERFSQQIKAAIAQAQASKDAGLEAELMKEYLDVKRKIKEFTSFYDEA